MKGSQKEMFAKGGWGHRGWSREADGQSWNMHHLFECK